MKPFEIRLADHHSRNARHLRNLRAFCKDQARFSRLSQEDRNLILAQIDYMSSLDIILEQRMRRLNIPV